jgi:hypothetical protein
MENKMANIWLMSPDNKNIQVVKYDFKLGDKFPNLFECRQFWINDIMEYFVIFFDAEDGGAYNASAKWVAPYCGVAPTGNFIVMRKKWIGGEEHTINMDISPKDFKQKYLK